MTLISSINKLFILLLLSIGATSPSYAALFDDWTDNQLCEWMDQPSPPEIIQGQVSKRLISCSEGIAKGWGEASNTFDGAYSFILSRTNPSEGKTNLGTGQFQIKNGIISIAKNTVISPPAQRNIMILLRVRLIKKVRLLLHLK